MSRARDLLEKIGNAIRPNNAASKKAGLPPLLMKRLRENAMASALKGVPS